MVIWGVISAATAGVHNYAGLLSVRFFLGFIEAAYFVRYSLRIPLEADDMGPTPRTIADRTRARLFVLPVLLVRPI